MPMNNNVKVQSAAARLAKLPLVRSACTKLSVLYTDTKCSHPNLRSVCEGLEGGVTAVLSPVVVKLEPQISIANGFACKSLDWLENTFPVVHTPTEEIVATAKNKMHEIQATVHIAASGTVECVQHMVTWLRDRLQQADQADQPLIERAIRVARVGLDCALIVSEALMDQVLPPTEKDKEEEAAAAQMLEGFEAAALRRNYPMRLVSVPAKLWKRTCRMLGSKMPSVQVMENGSRSPGLVQDLQSSWLTLVCSIQGLPQYMHQQLVSMLFIIFQMYNLHCPPSQQQSHRDRSSPGAAETSACEDVVQAQTPRPACRKRPAKMSGFDSGCDVAGCGRR